MAATTKAQVTVREECPAIGKGPGTQEGWKCISGCRKHAADFRIVPETAASVKA